jgi:hypothetical protein
VDLATELLAMIAEDDAVRARLAQDGALFRHCHRQSDGIPTLRVIERMTHRVQLCGAIYADVATQELATFWLDLAVSDASGVGWTIHVDPTGSAREARHALWLASTATDVAWQITVRGTATVIAGRLCVDAADA